MTRWPPSCHPASVTPRAGTLLLNIHRAASLYVTFPAGEARRLAKRLEFHHTPKHAGWLNVAEIEFSALTRDRLQGRHGDEPALVAAIGAYETRRNPSQVAIDWRFQHSRRRHQTPSPLFLQFLTSSGARSERGHYF